MYNCCNMLHSCKLSLLWKVSSGDHLLEPSLPALTSKGDFPAFTHKASG